ncbi:MAG: cytochrome b/b6 domain-containing protein [Candidatus Acidiferrales bacterium]
MSDRKRKIGRSTLLVLAPIVTGLFSFPAHAQTKSSPNPDADCLACHGQKDLKAESGRSVYIDETKHLSSAHSILHCTDCHTGIKDFPHPARIAKVSCATCHADEAAEIPKSIHAALGAGAQACTACHGSPHDLQPAAGLLPTLCITCHADEVKGFLASVHGAAAKRGDPDAPTCQSCHGPVHKILAAQDPASPVAKKNLPDTCGSCHSNPSFLATHEIPFAHPVESYKLSVHGRAVAAGNLAAATCSDCHGSHEIYAARDPRSKINHWNVPATCGACHGEIEKIYAESVHGQAVAHGAGDAPVCTDCHGEHVILAPNEPASLVNPVRVSFVTCGRCHGNQVITARYNLPADRVPSYADSFHGLDAQAGSQTVANCASCHGIHNIFPASDPRSTVNPANLAHTCGACHPGAGQRFAIGPVHILPESRSESPAVRIIRRVYLVLIPLAIGLMFLHQLLDFLRKFFRHERPIGPQQAAFRLNIHFRIAHALTLISFPLLVVTGFALKYPLSWWARPMLMWEGRFAFRGTVHRIAAVVLLVSLVYHVVNLIVSRRARLIIGNMRPQMRDFRDLQDMVAYNLGLSEKKPDFGEFTYVEKTEYLAYMWGAFVMTLTGFLLWFNSFVLRHFPKWVLDAATALHFYEAVLATLAIVIWHMYSVVFDPDVYPMDRVRLLSPAGSRRPEPIAEPREASAVPAATPAPQAPETPAKPSDLPQSTDAPDASGQPDESKKPETS